ncbi:MAG: DUF2269 domain-containing protein [Rhizobiaceae bacterium]
MILYLHVIGATVLLGTGAGIAFFMVMANATRNPTLIAHVANTVVTADLLFTATAVVAQPVTGTLLAIDSGYPLMEDWLLASILLYIVTGLFWIPVVFIQVKLRSLAREAADKSLDLPPEYHRLYRVWFAFGFPAFASVLAIVWLMLAKPELPML